MERRRPSSRVILKAAAVWRLLDERDISQNELARLCGLSSGYMSQLMGGKRSPSAHARRRIQGVLGVTDFDELFIIERLDDPPGTSEQQKGALNSKGPHTFPGDRERPRRKRKKGDIHVQPGG